MLALSVISADKTIVSVSLALMRSRVSEAFMQPIFFLFNDITLSRAS